MTCRLAARSGAKSRVLSCLRVRVTEARFSLLGYHVTSRSWTGSTGSLGCSRMGRTGLSFPACRCHSQSFALVNTHSCHHLHKSELHGLQLPSIPTAGRGQSAIQASQKCKPLSVNHQIVLIVYSLTTPVETAGASSDSVQTVRDGNIHLILNFTSNR